MAESTLPLTSTPKRKRDNLTAEWRLPASPTPGHAAKTVFSFQPPRFQSPIRLDPPSEDGSSSPRSKVAQKFRDLAIRENTKEPKGVDGSPESGGGVTTPTQTPDLDGLEETVAPDLTRFTFDAGTAATYVDMQLDSDEQEATAAARKRPKTLELGESHPEPAVNPLSDEGPTSHDLSALTDGTTASASSIGVLDSWQKSHPSINRLVDSKSRSRKRMGTPPPSSRRKNQSQSQLKKGEEEEESVIVDPVRAALTWQDDEITIYDPKDKDDDGTGINGIGFKPTAAVAYQRAQKRRQQLAEYKKREESEARARRNQRRREQSGEGAGGMTRKHSMVRVHFSDTPPTTIMTT
ncbi:hypothetical protein NPX13_g10684 [Xylaria arbuscula]|uniref:Uncharacterized protein n=1 Tax=Xylaria arbuscula TaxID=114810 RepID=A0A9W8TH98_9PEZI|nr:hypothetical protein NPX13_g10684 [Xylaria arbuscula]